MTSPSLPTRAARRVRGAVRPRVEVSPAPEGVVVDWDVPVVVRDGTTLRVNVFRPADGVPAPAIMSAHPYGKDAIPARTRSGHGVNPQYRMFPQPEPVRISEWTSWEAPDPAFWVPNGYVVVNADLRGGGTSDGTDDLLSDLEAQDYYDLIEWVGTQPWCTGKVGLDGVSYLAISQYKVAALRPPHLAAICPWEGFTDLYRDFARPGGVREDGFSIIWSAMTRRAARVEGNLREEIVARPERDDWYESKTPDLEGIEVPMLVCGSFSDHSLHTRGSFEAFRRTSSAQRWLYTHRDGKWSHYYSDEASRTRLQFFDHVLKGIDNGWAERPPVRIAVHEAGPEPVAVTLENAWPPADLTWQTLYLDATERTLGDSVPQPDAAVAFRTQRGTASFTWTVPEDLDVIGHLAARLHVELRDCDDVHLFVGVRKLRGDEEVAFEGSFGFAYDMVSKGWQRVAHRELDEALSTPWQPVHTHRTAEPLQPGEIVPVDVALRPHATRFRAGDVLRLDVQARWFYPRDPVRGQLPTGYQRSEDGVCLIHCGPEHPSSLLLGTRPTSVTDALVGPPS
ncbi:MAG: CocE/NonD family hydrolase [Candidatus Nanopelagicales bacterium]